jgi:hypothetical protein
MTDEAINLVRANKNEDALTKKMDTLKSLANIHGTTLLLVGSYDLYPLMNRCGQVSRRSTLVHFERYHSEITSDVVAFSDALGLLQSALPLDGVPDLKPYAKELMHVCVGCVGNLKDTLTRAMSIGLESYQGQWNAKCLQKEILSKAQIATILLETEEGEKEIKDALFGSNHLNFQMAS